MDLGSIPLSYLICILVCLLGGAYFAAAETSLASVSKIRMISDADDKVLYILDNFDEALTTLLIGNNIMHILCSSFATVLASRLWGNAGVTVSTFLITFIVFIFAEMIPKSYAKDCCESFSKKIAPSVIVLMKLLSPVVFIFNSITGLIARFFPTAKDEDITVTEEELTDIIENIDEDDEIDEDTTELLQSALEFTETRTKEIQIPWDRVVTITDQMTEEEIYDVIDSNHYSRLPVLGSDGNILGVLHIRKYLKAKIKGRKVLKTRSMLDKPYYISSTMPLDDILPDMSKHRTHMAFVKNGAGQVTGIITVEDILEELVGEIYDEEEVAKC